MREVTRKLAGLGFCSTDLRDFSWCWGPNRSQVSRGWKFEVLPLLKPSLLCAYSLWPFCLVMVFHVFFSKTSGPSKPCRQFLTWMLWCWLATPKWTLDIAAVNLDFTSFQPLLVYMYKKYVYIYIFIFTFVRCNDLLVCPGASHNPLATTCMPSRRYRLFLGGGVIFLFSALFRWVETSN